MKKTLLIALMLTVTLSLCAQTAIEPSGEGSEEQPYQIASLENLYWLQTNSFANFAVQTADINAAETATWFSDGEGGYYGWPVGSCIGNYDGQGYAIDSLYINRTSTDNVGLFGNATGPVTGYYDIKNLRLTNVDITGNDAVGAFVGISSKYNISNCSSSGEVNGNSMIGGIAGRFNAPFESPDTLSNSYSTASITAASLGGGLIGSATGATNGEATIMNCYAKGSVSSGGGLIGSVTKSSLLMCYATGTVTTGGGLVYSTDSGGEGGSTDLLCYWDFQTVGQVTSAHGTLKNTNDMKTQSTFSGWDFASTWAIDGSINDGYPYLQENLPEDALPICLNEFTAVQENGSVLITWKTESETDNARFLLYRNGAVIAILDGAGTTSEPHYYSYCDDNVVPGMTYVYTLADVSFANEIILHEDLSIAMTIEGNDLNKAFVLKKNYPNPFNPTTIIPVELNEASQVKLAVYDISGKLVRTLVNENCSAGSQEILWDGKNNAGANVESGMYIARLTTESTSDFIKMLLTK